MDALLALDPELTTEVIRRNIHIKAAIVSEDEKETGGVRELLNYGHTLAMPSKRRASTAPSCTAKPWPWA
jgi:3-dehydroquinate synthetase